MRIWTNRNKLKSKCLAVVDESEVNHRKTAAERQHPFLLFLSLSLILSYCQHKQNRKKKETEESWTPKIQLASRSITIATAAQLLTVETSELRSPKVDCDGRCKLIETSSSSSSFFSTFLLVFHSQHKQNDEKMKKRKVSGRPFFKPKRFECKQNREKEQGSATKSGRKMKM